MGTLFSLATGRVLMAVDVEKVCMYIYIYMCVYVCMYVCMYACMYVCMYVCINSCCFFCFLSLSNYFHILFFSPVFFSFRLVVVLIPPIAISM